MECKGLTTNGGLRIAINERNLASIMLSLNSHCSGTRLIVDFDSITNYLYFSSLLQGKYQSKHRSIWTVNYVQNGTKKNIEPNVEKLQN